MKKIPLIVLLIIGISSFAQDTVKDYKNSIIFIPHKMIYNSLAIGYERDISSVYSLYLLSQIFYNENREDYQKGFVQSFGIKNYVVKGKEVLDFRPSFYFMPFVQAGAFDTQEEIEYWDSDENKTYIDKREYNSYGGGFLMGFGLTVAQKITVNFYFGGEAMFHDYQMPDDYPLKLLEWRDSEMWEGVSPKGGIEFSYRF